MQIFSVTGAPGTVSNKVLSPFYDGEGFAIDLEVRDRLRKAVADLSEYDVYVTLSNSPGGSDPGTPNIIEYHLVSDADTAFVTDEVQSVVRFVFRASALEVLDEGKPYFYNLWSRRLGDDPDVQAVGSLSPILSIRAAQLVGVVPILPEGAIFITFDDGALIQFGDGANYIQEEAL